jgi:hypothetical protein
MLVRVRVHRRMGLANRPPNATPQPMIGTKVRIAMR